MEHNELRQRCLDAIESVEWVPTRGSGGSTLCSRRASTGAPCGSVSGASRSPLFHRRSCAEVVDADWIDHLANSFADHTSDIWYDWSVEQPLPKGACCPSCGSEDLDKDSIFWTSGSTRGSHTPQRVMIKTRSISTLRAQINTVGGFTPPCSSRLRRAQRRLTSAS